MSSVTFWYTGDELERSDNEQLYVVMRWCDREISYQTHRKELDPQSPRYETIILLDETIEECQRILANRGDK